MSETRHYPLQSFALSIVAGVIFLSVAMSLLFSTMPLAHKNGIFSDAAATFYLERLAPPANESIGADQTIGLALKVKFTKEIGAYEANSARALLKFSPDSLNALTVETDPKTVVALAPQIDNEKGMVSVDLARWASGGSNFGDDETLAVYQFRVVAKTNTQPEVTIAADSILGSPERNLLDLSRLEPLVLSVRI